MFKIGGIILKDSKMLVVHKRGMGPELIIPGGLVEKGETHYQTLKRELKEELRADLKSMEYFDSFQGKGVFEQTPLTIHTYVSKIEGEPTPDNEIDNMVWIDRDFKGYKLGPMLSDQIIPEMKKRGLF